MRLLCSFQTLNKLLDIRTIVNWDELLKLLYSNCLTLRRSNDFCASCINASAFFLPSLLLVIVHAVYIYYDRVSKYRHIHRPTYWYTRKENSTTRSICNIPVQINITIHLTSNSIHYLCDKNMSFSWLLYGQVSGVQLVYGLHSDGFSYDVGLADCHASGSAIHLCLSHRDCETLLHRRQHRQGKPPLYSLSLVFQFVRGPRSSEFWRSSRLPSLSMR